MERLTSNTDDISYICNFLNRHSNYDGDRFKAIHKKLAEYEDIGMTPMEIKLFLKDFGISQAIEIRELKKQHEEDKEIIKKMAERINVFEERYFEG